MMYLPTVLNDGPSNYFRLGDLTGTLARDEALNRYIGQIIGGVTLGQNGAIPNYTDTAMLFDGSTGYIDLSTFVPQSPIITIETWFNLSNISFASYPRLIANDNVGTSNLGIELGVDALGVGVFANLGFTSSFTDLGYGLQFNPATWYHLAVTYDGSTAILYLNGQPVVTTAVNLTLAPGGFGFNIGRNPSYTGDYFPGLQDELAVYNGQALSAAQIANHYLAGISNQAENYTVCISAMPVLVDGGTLQAQSSIGKHGQASFTATTDPSNLFQQYEQVAVYDQFGALPFTGYVNQPVETPLGYNDPLGYHGSISVQVNCMDQIFLANKRLIADAYVNKTCGFMVQDILNTILSQEGVTRGQIYDGLTPSPTLFPSPTLYPGGNVGLIPTANFGYCKVSDALAALTTAASSSGVPYYSMIDPLKRLWFVPYTTVVNNTLIDGSQQQNIKVTRANPTYRNQQTVLGGVTQTVTQNQSFKGDNSTTVWILNFDIATVPTVKVNTVTKTVGIKGVDADNTKDFFWNKGDPSITQASAATKLISTDTLAVTYIGQYPNNVISQNASQVSYQASIDGTSGIIEDVSSDSSLNDTNSALQVASSQLTLNAQQGLQLTFDTMMYGLQPGQLVTVDMPWHNIHMQQLLIDSVTASDQIDGYNIWYSVIAVLGPYDVSWIDFYSKQLTNPTTANAINVGSTQSTNVLQSFTCSVSDTAVLTTNVYSCPLMSGSTIMSPSLIMC